MKRILLKVIRVYQYFISPLLGNHCRFEPSCSQYMHEAVQSFGVLRGSAMGFSRLCRCHPWSKGGQDPVPDECCSDHQMNRRGKQI